jgi:hypothetical protein
LWEAYFQQLVQWARPKRTGRARSAADEKDVALRAFDSFCRGAAQVDLRAELGQPRRPEAQALRATAWFENGAPVRNRRGRAGRFDVTRRQDPVLLTQQRIREKLNDHFSYLLAVSFASQGE